MDVDAELIIMGTISALCIVSAGLVCASQRPPARNLRVVGGPQRARTLVKWSFPKVEAPSIHPE